VKIVDTAQMMVTTRRTFDASAAMIYRHDIQWRPNIADGVIVQRICRHLKVKGKILYDTVYSKSYWEAWEIFQGHVYPFNLQRGTPPFIPNGKARPGQIHFDPGAEPPYMKAKATMAMAGAATGANHQAATHDRFTEGGAEVANREGKWKIYGEAYLLSKLQVRQQMGWLRTFKVDYLTGAGNLPMRADDAYKPLAQPTVLRYEAGEFDFTKGRSISRNRVFPSGSKIARYPCGKGGDVDVLGMGLNQHY